MHAVTTIRRALMLLLLLPALLVPSGWSLRVCFCAAMSGAAVEDDACCRKEAPPNCCGEESPAQEQGDHSTCSECRTIAAGDRNLPPSLPTTPDVPPAIAFELPTWSVPDASEAHVLPICSAVRVHAPPPLEATPPLRI
jgi:hypothetical protein